MSRLEAGLKYANAGNVVDPHRETRYCPGCGGVVSGRGWHAITSYRLEADRCRLCDHRSVGWFRRGPGPLGRAGG
jgi:pyruvate formate lyase activating enzyme